MKHLTFLFAICLVVLRGTATAAPDGDRFLYEESPAGIIFACMIDPPEFQHEAATWAGSIRSFGGRYAHCPLWVLVPASLAAVDDSLARELARLDVRLIPFPIDARLRVFPLAAKVAAAAFAESLAVSRSEILVWMDPDNLVVQEPLAFRLPPGVDLGVCPVHHTLIGSEFAKPPNPFWSAVYKACGVQERRMYPMVTLVDRKTLRPYYNAGLIVVRPQKELLKNWRDNMLATFRTPEFAGFYQENSLTMVFMHQAVLAATILSMCDKSSLIELPTIYNYPLILMSRIAPEYRVRRMNELVTVRIDSFARNPEWAAMLRCDEPLRSWLTEQFRVNGHALWNQ